MSGKVLVAASIKGGVGKSTLVSCLAIYWMQAGKSVGLIDTDPNKTLTRWHEKGGRYLRRFCEPNWTNMPSQSGLRRCLQRMT